MQDFAGNGAPLSDTGLGAACTIVRTGAAELWAVLSVETSGCGFLPDRRPKILFERHFFSRLTDHRFDATHPEVSQPSAGGYGASGAHQYDRLAIAISLDREAALQSASWGLGQIMGANFHAAGFGSVDDMVDAMVVSEDGQLAAMAAFAKAGGLDKLLAAHDWQGFARHYNGPDYAAHNYDGHLNDYYQHFSAGSLPDLRIRLVQVYLFYKGFSPGSIDGVLGNRTTAAIAQFQHSTGVPVTGRIDDQLIAALTA